MELNQENGFTLIELVLVLAIIATVSLTVIPLVNTSNLKIRISSYQVLSSLWKVRQTAIAKSSDYIVKIVSSNHLAVLKEGDSTYTEIIELDDKITITSTRSNNQIKFTPLGTAQAGSFIISSGGCSKKITVAGNGKTRIVKE